jgi:serine phosphatase RsbU (regulator of sigma subunit)
MEETRDEFPNFNLEEILRKQLTTFALSSEISRVVSSATNLEAVIHTLGLGFQELLGYKKVAVFQVNPSDFSLGVLGSTGIPAEALRQLRFGLEFIAGEYGDAIFRNRHVIVESVPEDDAFSALGSTQYAAFPIVGRIMSNCWEAKKCGCTTCPCFEQPGSICWATEGSALFTQTRFEDDRRKACVNCPQFKCLGVLWLDLTNRAMITGDDVSVISSIMLQTGLVLENFQMYDILKSKNQLLSDTNGALEDANRKIRRDLDRAKGIQTKLLPSFFPTGLRGVAAHYAAHIEIGGDYYDCFEIAPQKFALVVADVSGHGVSAALVMSMFKTLLKQIAPTTESPAETLHQINKVFVEEVNTDMFVTVFYAIWDKGTNLLRWTNAGHPPIMLVNQESGAILNLHSRGLFLGMFDDTKCTDQVTSLIGPHRILLYTDGIIEATSETSEQFGEERMREILQGSRQEHPTQAIQSILEKLTHHVGSKPLDDDLTLLCCDL